MRELYEPLLFLQRARLRPNTPLGESFRWHITKVKATLRLGPWWTDSNPGRSCMAMGMTNDPLSTDDGEVCMALRSLCYCTSIALREFSRP